VVVYLFVVLAHVDVVGALELTDGHLAAAVKGQQQQQQQQQQDKQCKMLTVEERDHIFSRYRCNIMLLAVQPS
jgi:hypothetical protein